MPNWASNRVVVTGAEEALTEFVRRHFRNDEEEGRPVFDFETVVPMPTVVRATDGLKDGDLGLIALDIALLGRTTFGGRQTLEDVLGERWAREAGITSRAGLLAYLEGHRPDVLEAAERLVACHRETGCDDWYEWSRSNWGSKWNAEATELIDLDVGSLTFFFLSASSMPEPVFRALGPLHPKLTFEIAATDPDNDWAITGRVAGDVAEFEEADVREAYALIYGEMPEAA